MRAACAASHFPECDRIPARAAGDEILLRWDCPRAWSSRRAADGRDPSIRLLVPFFLKFPHVATPPLTRGELVMGVRVPSLPTRYLVPDDRLPGTGYRITWNTTPRRAAPAQQSECSDVMAARAFFR